MEARLFVYVFNTQQHKHTHTYRRVCVFNGFPAIALTRSGLILSLPAAPPISFQHKHTLTCYIIIISLTLVSVRKRFNDPERVFWRRSWGKSLWARTLRHEINFLSGNEEFKFTRLRVKCLSLSAACSNNMSQYGIKNPVFQQNIWADLCSHYPSWVKHVKRGRHGNFTAFLSPESTLNFWDSHKLIFQRWFFFIPLESQQRNVSVSAFVEFLTSPWWF